jgi:hypothetical protein
MHARKQETTNSGPNYTREKNRKNFFFLQSFGQRRCCSCLPSCSYSPSTRPPSTPICTSVLPHSHPSSSNSTGFSSSSSSLAYLGIGVGSIFGLFLAGGLSDRMLKALTTKNGGEPKPEYRLPLMTIGGFLVPVGLFWYGWSAQEKTHYMVPITGTSFLGGGMVIAYVSLKNSSS